MSLNRFKGFIISIAAMITMGVAMPLASPTTVVQAKQATTNQTLAQINNTLTRYQVGQRAIYFGDNNRVVLDHFPISETDTLSRVHNEPIDNVNGVKFAKVKIVATRVAKWQVRYYLVRFADGIAGWVNSGDLHPVDFNQKDVVQYSTGTYQKAAKLALKYLNAVRKQHGLGQLTWNDQFAQIAQYRGPQMAANFAHVDANGNKYRNLASQALGYGDLGNVTIENIANANNFAGNTPNKAIIQRINSMLYEDGPVSNWGHRNAFLDANIKQIGIAIQTNGKMFNMAFIMQ
ncbi:CAP domain-containing protein [Nicoliella lavandulae]|uniref:CAP domain-containing protein n=1 Tax=Nicoliella lavandulae TaxID=3082954 RepID=A0ABU8SJP9_9LACO